MAASSPSPRAPAAERAEHGDRTFSPASDRSYVWSVGSEPRVERAETGTAALAAIFANMDKRKRGDTERRAAGQSPFESGV
ncbi:hypothetical protein Q5752_003931 [Cryptotrichosporon argae]